MIKVTIDSVRISLMTQNRVVVLRELKSPRYLPIWIGAAEADAITMRLQGISIDRPLTHDLLFNIITTLGAHLSYVVVTELKNDIFYAEIVLEHNERELRIDARPSDAIALAVRAEIPIYVMEPVLEEAGRVPETKLTPSSLFGASEHDETETDAAPEDLGAFADFIAGLDLDDLTSN